MDQGTLGISSQHFLQVQQERERVICTMTGNELVSVNNWWAKAEYFSQSEHQINILIKKKKLKNGQHAFLTCFSMAMEQNTCWFQTKPFKISNCACSLMMWGISCNQIWPSAVIWMLSQTQNHHESHQSRKNHTAVRLKDYEEWGGAQHPSLIHISEPTRPP